MMVESGQGIGSVLISIMNGAQGQDITTLMGKVAVGLEYVHQQQQHNKAWVGASDVTVATALLDGVTSDPLSVLTGLKNAGDLMAADDLTPRNTVKSIHTGDWDTQANIGPPISP